MTITPHGLKIANDDLVRMISKEKESGQSQEYLSRVKAAVDASTEIDEPLTLALLWGIAYE